VKTLSLTTKDDAAAKMWQDYVEKNQDSYGFGCIEVASKLGKNLDDGMTPAEAEKAAVKGSGITGFMMGAVAQMIWQMHPRGEEFKKYFNGEFGADPDADGIVNPAIMTVGDSESIDMDLTGQEAK
jgi:hypothetical protein